MSIDTRLGIVGVGAMGGAIARGLVSSGALAADRLVVFDADAEHAASLARELGAQAAESARELASGDVECVLLAVKPQVLPGVAADLADCVAGKLVISIAAGITTETLAGLMGKARIVRVMPNLPIAVGSGASAVCAGTSATAEDVELVRSMFATLGSAHVMTEHQLDVAGAVSGCGPAYFALMVDELTRSGIRAGLPAAACREMALATMRGVAEQLLAGDVHPRAYIERVTSPGGTTAAALRELEPFLMEGVDAAVDAALERTRELAGE